MLKKLAFIALFILTALPCFAGEETSFRISDREGFTRFVLDLQKKPDYKLFTLNNPPRAVIDLKNVILGKAVNSSNTSNFIIGIRRSIHDNDTRLVLDLSQDVTIKQSFIINPSSDKAQYRLVIEITPITPAIDTKEEVTLQKKLDDEIQSSQPKTAAPIPTLKPSDKIFIPIPVLKTKRKPLIVIDPGHGGHDPGTIGRWGVQEKDITLDYAKELKKQLLETGKYNVYLTRESDIFIELQQRVLLSRKAKGDLFISLHVNSHENPAIEGLSVYTLSENASDKEADNIAKKENKSGVLDSIDLGNQQDDIAELFIDMTQRETKNLSASFGETLINIMQNKVKILQNPHRFAGFRVLTGIDIPAVLIELGYITNKKEEKLLTAENYKNELAKGIVEAIDNHFDKYNLE